MATLEPRRRALEAHRVVDDLGDRAGAGELGDAGGDLQDSVAALADLDKRDRHVAVVLARDADQHGA